MRMERLIEATWDQSVLGMRSQTLYLSESCTTEELASLDRMDAPYRVVRLPIGAHSVLHEVQERGYVFAELQTRMHHIAEVPKLSGAYARAVASIELREATEHDVSLIRESILAGAFRTDRVSLDPRFGVVVSARRYSQWLSQALADGALCNVLVRSGVPFAFSLQKKERQHYIGLLGGLLDGRTSLGLGWCIPYFEIVTSVRQEASDGVYLTFSSNNAAVQRTAQELGFRVTYQEYVFVNKPSLSRDSQSPP